MNFSRCFALLNPFHMEDACSMHLLITQTPVFSIVSSTIPLCCTNIMNPLEIIPNVILASIFSREICSNCPILSPHSLLLDRCLHLSTVILLRLSFSKFLFSMRIGVNAISVNISKPSSYIHNSLVNSLLWIL